METPTFKTFKKYRILPLKYFNSDEIFSMFCTGVSVNQFVTEMESCLFYIA